MTNRTKSFLLSPKFYSINSNIIIRLPSEKSILKVQHHLIQQLICAMEQEITKELVMDPVLPLQFIYQRTSVDATIQKQVEDPSTGKYHKEQAQRRILKVCSGKFSPGTMTAILGPSGSGKTTLLNLLSGRLLSKNLDIHGRIIINGKQVDNIGEYKQMVGYVMQEDLLMPTFTPRETFKFVIDMRLANKSEQEKNVLVENLIGALGLTKCADTYVGNSMIRGISGGEKKRTSIGTELLINPSLIFLDEPTTGLDSTTALHVVQFLNKLASKGRTVITTIHQPSSQIFQQFDQILLMLDGNIVYHGNSLKSINYFRDLNLPVPHHSNPMDHYMKVMNKEGIEIRYLQQGIEYTENQVQKQFDERVDFLVSNFQKNQVSNENECREELVDRKISATWGGQLKNLLKRNFLNIARNPLALRAQIGQSIFFSVLTIILFQRRSDDFNNYLQNTAGVVNFIAMNIVFSAVFSTLNVFSSERPVFIRERLSNTYQPSSYFVSRILAFLPLDIIIPLLLILIPYFAVHLDPDADNFFRTAAACWLGAFMSSAYGLLLSALFADPEVSMSLVPILVIPFLLLGGFFAPLQDVHDFFRWIEYLSMFKYTYQSMIQAQFFDGVQFTSEQGDTTENLSILEDETAQFFFDEAYWLNLMLMGIIGLFLRFLAFLALYMISNPKKLNLKPPLQDPTSRNPKSPVEINLDTKQKLPEDSPSKNESNQNLKKKSSSRIINPLQ